jgi:hypothetical protein
MISELGFKDMQNVQVAFFIKANQSNQQQVLNISNKNCVPMGILSKEAHSNTLFRLLNLISSKAGSKKKANLSHKKWEVVVGSWILFGVN